VINEIFDSQSNLQIAKLLCDYLTTRYENNLEGIWRSVCPFLVPQIECFLDGMIDSSSQQVLACLEMVGHLFSISRTPDDVVAMVYENLHLIEERLGEGGDLDEVTLNKLIHHQKSSSNLNISNFFKAVLKANQATFSSSSNSIPGSSSSLLNLGGGGDRQQQGLKDLIVEGKKIVVRNLGIMTIFGMKVSQSTSFSNVQLLLFFFFYHIASQSKVS